MKTKIFTVLALLFMAKIASAQAPQSCTIENFSGQTSGWTYSQGAHVGNYTNPTMGCADDRGIITPGVGGNNPCNIQTPEFTSTGAAIVTLTFDMIVLNANLKCNTWKDYPCQTSIDVFYYIGGTKYKGIIDQLLPPSGPSNSSNVLVSFDAGNNLPAGTVYKIEMCFKPKSGVGNCIQQNTKYVFDNFKNCETASREVNERSAANGTSQETMTGITVNPNPTNGASKVTVNAGPNIKTISLVNDTGKTLRLASGITFIRFDVKDLPAGKYEIRIERNDGKTISKTLSIN